MINEGNKFIHWNHFLALEKDLETISRYVELTSDTNNTYSIELAKLLFSASSEFDVVMKELCKILDSNSRRNNIDDYREIIKTHLPLMINEKVYINRFGLNFQPFLEWVGDENPIWWQGYNKVKHHRVEHYDKANLKNTLNALGALLITITYFYKIELSGIYGKKITFSETNWQLKNESNLLRLNDSYYRDFLEIF